MAIVRIGGQGSEEFGLARRVGLKAAKKAGKKAAKKAPGKKHAAKHADKHAAKKHADKHAAKKHADKHAAKKHAGVDSADQRLQKKVDKAESKEDDPLRPAGEHAVELALAFHHLQRAGAVISLLEHDSGGDLRLLLEHGIELYRSATAHGKRKAESVLCAHGLLSAAEHLGMAGLYSARADYRIKVAPPQPGVVADHLKRLAPRLDKLAPAQREIAQRLESMARELLRRARGSEDDRHLQYELTMAADGICSALEQGL